MLTGRGRGGRFLGSQRRNGPRRQGRERFDETDNLEAGVGVRQGGETDWKQDNARPSKAEPVVRTAARFLGDYIVEVAENAQPTESQRKKLQEDWHSGKVDVDITTAENEMLILKFLENLDANEVSSTLRTASRNVSENE